MSAATEKKLVVISPVNQAKSATDTTLATRLATLRGKRIGLIDNSKTNAGRMLDAIVTILDTQYGFSNVVHHRKPSASKPVAPEVIDDFLKMCDLAIVGVGD
jgi:hypothetical protein